MPDPVAIALFALNVLTYAVLAAWILTREWTRPAWSIHACETCGYNLKGNSSGTCPECGGEVSGPG